MKIGLLPLYLKLYDDTCEYARPRVDSFLNVIARRLGELGLDVIGAPVCRIKPEFSSAVGYFEECGAEAIVTLHLAYSPSLESVDALAGTKLPILVLDTTESYAFDASVDSGNIMYNHGIHGVQDMCNMLLRRGKPFEIFAGHYEKSGVLERIAAYCLGLEIAGAFRGARIGLAGEPFDGMGDFQVPFDDLKRDFGIEVINYDFEAGGDLISKVTDREMAHERQADADFFEWDASVTDEVYGKSARVCLALRKWTAGNRLAGMSVNFMAASAEQPGLPVMPFTECCKLMASGAGYAGEGDVLTAALCGAVLRAYPESTFTEMFCPDWKGGAVFLSHMGEFNYRICSGKPRLTEKDFPYTSAANPIAAYGTYKPGYAVLINLLPRGNGKYTLILAPGEVLPVSGKNMMADSVNGWFKPAMELTSFLESYSRAGGTHHSVLCYADCIDAMTGFAANMGFDLTVLK